MVYLVGAVERFHTRKFELKVQAHHREMRVNPRSYRLAIPVGILVFDLLLMGNDRTSLRVKLALGSLRVRIWAQVVQPLDLEAGDPCFEYFRYGIYLLRIVGSNTRHHKN
ncbi:uncharacterized protein CIMG_11137 [Coccidioides immitis RS]|uniref:Uncharacterized protein n=1 Tax=Coccidioides immitis (strain RS) TaxID=246410 RepID=A0A0D8JWJ0_COCIM|nr:uncharacterized protein CIMG_11137 [Coccidioides immitis RS]KJF61509.1 hypothetical protein CIMG_11137 [Coccidioides immitis RS]